MGSGVEGQGVAWGHWYPSGLCRPPRGCPLSDSDSSLPQAHTLTEKQAEARLKAVSSQGLEEPALTLASCWTL